MLSSRGDSSMSNKLRQDRSLIYQQPQQTMNKHSCYRITLRHGSYRRKLLAFLVLLSWSRSVRCFAVESGEGAGGRSNGSSSWSGCTTWKSPITVSSSLHNKSLLRGGGHGLSSIITTLASQRTDDGSAGAAADFTSSSSDSIIQQNHHPSHIQSSYATAAVPTVELGMWPAFDALDKRLIKISLPVIANFAINPLIGAIDLLWVSRMGDALAIAGQAAANQVFNSVFWLASFLPSISAIIISQENARGNKEGVQDAVCQAVFVGLIFSILTSTMLLLFPEQILKAVLQEGAPALAYAKPYLFIRGFATLPSLLSVVGFSAFRGVQDTITPVKISLFANLFNAVLDPILIFTLAMGVPGAALATLAAEVIAAITYIKMMHQRKMLRFSKLLKPPKWSKLSPLLRGGAALQLRNVALNVAFLLVARATQTIDKSGVAAAAHALSIQTFQVGGIVLLALSSVAQTVVPNDLELGGKRHARSTVKRLMTWGFVLGTLLGGLQLALLPFIYRSTPIQEIRNVARAPAIIGSVLQIINGMVFIGEGVMIGTRSFLQLSIGTIIATTGIYWALQIFPAKYGLTGVWIGFGVWNTLRLISVLVHQLFNGPLSLRKIKQAEATP